MGVFESRLRFVHDGEESNRSAFRSLKGMLLEGVVTQSEKDELSQMKETMRVDDEVHKQELKAAGWSEDEYHRG